MSGPVRSVGGGGSLVDERSEPSLRDRIAVALAGARRADFAVARVRIAGLDLGDAELGAVQRCRLLLGRLDAAMLLDTADGAARDRAGRRHLDALRRFAATGRLEIRCSGVDAWLPDFSIYQGARPLALLGAHYFWQPAPAGGAALTCELREPADIARLQRRFDELWARGYDVLGVVREALAALAPPVPRYRSPGSLASARRVREVGSAWRTVGAADAARRMLRTRLGTPARAGSAPVFELAAFQRDAAARAARILQRRRGVLVADSVGLGKTYIGLALVEAALQRGEPVLIAAPAALADQWLRPLRRLARRLGTAAPARLHGTRWPAAPLIFASHAALSRGLPAIPPGREPRLIVVDEAHALRNPGTRRYRAVAALCRTGRIALLTATPVNNSPADLHALIRLFAGESEFRDVGVPDLAAALRGERHPTPRAPARDDVMRVLRAVMIRRTRPFIREHYRGVDVPADDGASRVLVFPARAAPVALRYDLAAAAPNLAAALDSDLAALTGAAHAAIRERLPAPGEAALLRFVLLKRLESSAHAFLATIARQIRFHTEFLRALRRGLLLVPAHESADGDGDPLQLTLDEVLYRPLPRRLDGERLEAEAIADLERLKRLRDTAAPLVTTDPKLAALRGLLSGPDLAVDAPAPAKIVVFTEYRETARALWRALRGRPGGVALVDGGGARLGLGACGRREAIERFAPTANGARQPPERERVALLIATDVLAEGLNLQDAAHVVSYDLPWNPVRLIQRVGRVDRLGSLHATVHSYHLLPDPVVERALRVTARLRAKIAGIHATVGAEHAILDDDDGASERYRQVVQRLAAGDPALLDEIEREEAAPFELEERLRLALRRRLAETPDGHGDSGTEMQRAGPCQAPIAATLPTDIRWPKGSPQRRVSALVACRVAGHVAWLLVDRNGAVHQDDATAAELLLAALEIETGNAPRKSGNIPEPAAVRLRAAVTAARRYTAAHLAADAPAPRGVSRVRAAAADRLLLALAAEPGGPTAELCERADVILRRLRAPAGVGSDHALRAALLLNPGGPARRLIDMLEVTLGEVSGASDPPESCELIGVLVVDEPEGRGQRSPA